MNVSMDEDHIAKNAQENGRIYHEVLFLMNFLQTMPQVKNKKIKSFDFHYTVIKNRDEKEIVNEDNENECNKFNDFITPNHYIGIETFNEKIR